MSDKEAGVTRRSAPVWLGGVASLAIAAAALFWIWTLAIPLPPETMCTAIYPAPAGCAGTARLLPATVWSILVIAATIGAFTLHRRSWWGAAGWVVLTALIGICGYIATLHVRVFVFA